MATIPTRSQPRLNARNNDRPSLIACRTVIGFGAPNRQGAEKAHGSPLGADEVKNRTALDWPHQPFQNPESVMSNGAGSVNADTPPVEAGSSEPDASIGRALAVPQFAKPKPALWICRGDDARPAIASLPSGLISRPGRHHDW